MEKATRAILSYPHVQIQLPPWQPPAAELATAHIAPTHMNNAYRLYPSAPMFALSPPPYTSQATSVLYEKQHGILPFWKSWTEVLYQGRLVFCAYVVFTTILVIGIALVSLGFVVRHT